MPEKKKYPIYCVVGASRAPPASASSLAAVAPLETPPFSLFSLSLSNSLTFSHLPQSGLKKRKKWIEEPKERKDRVCVGVFNKKGEKINPSVTKYNKKAERVKKIPADEFL
jgi:hypothetical protein